MCTTLKSHFRSLPDVRFALVKQVGCGLIDMLFRKQGARVCLPSDYDPDEFSLERRVYANFLKFDDKSASYCTFNKPSWLLGDAKLPHTFLYWLMENDMWAQSVHFTQAYLTLVGHTTFEGRCMCDFIDANNLAIALWVNCSIVF